MKRRKWDSRTKAEIVLQGFKGKPLADICNEYQISQTQYYQWRDQFLSNAGKVFATDLTKEHKDFAIIGRVVWAGRRF